MEESWERPELFDVQGWAEHARRVAAWAAAHPDLARAWDEALLAQRRREVALEQVDQERFLARHLVECGVGELTATAVGAGVRETPAVAIVREWLAHAGTFLLLLGKAGAGKTVAAAWVLGRARRAWSEGGVERWAYDRDAGLCVHAGELADAVFAGDERLLRRARVVPWLVIDDLGVEYSDQAGRWLGAFDRILNVRHEHRRRTVLTSNATPEAFRQRYGERIASRLRGSGRVADCGAEDLRRAS